MAGEGENRTYQKVENTLAKHVKGNTNMAVMVEKSSIWTQRLEDQKLITSLTTKESLVERRQSLLYTGGILPFEGSQDVNFQLCRFAVLFHIADDFECHNLLLLFSSIGVSKQCHHMLDERSVW